MFEKLFSLPRVVERHLAAPLYEDRVRYLHHLQDSGYSRHVLLSVAYDQIGLIRHLDLGDHDRVTIAQIEAATEEWARPGGRRCKHPAAPETKTRFIRRAVRWLRFVDRLDEPEKARHPHCAQVADYARWMREERGLSETTIEDGCVAADRFFEWLATKDIGLASVKIADIDDAITAKYAEGTWGRRTLHSYALRLRGFFRFAEGRGWCRPGLAAGIMPVRFRPDELVPRGLTRVDVERLLASTEGDRSADKRDRAILMLFVAYGLRTSEVCRLQLDDLDWDNETLRVHRSKTGYTDLYPLSRGVGRAIVRYMMEVRPAGSERTLFLTLLAPFGPLRRCSLGRMVRNRLDALGIVAARRGAHALRHAAAQHLLDQGMSMKVIGDFLGHRDPSSTSTYAKADLNALREVADFDLEGLI